jgi:hypothetical protein
MDSQWQQYLPTEVEFRYSDVVQTARASHKLGSGYLVDVVVVVHSAKCDVLDHSAHFDNDTPHSVDFAAGGTAPVDKGRLIALKQYPIPILLDVFACRVFHVAIAWITLEVIFLRQVATVQGPLSQRIRTSIVRVPCGRHVDE